MSALRTDTWYEICGCARGAVVLPDGRTSLCSQCEGTLLVPHAHQPDPEPEIDNADLYIA